MPDPAKRESSTSIYSPAERMATMNQLDQKYLQSHCLALKPHMGSLSMSTNALASPLATHRNKEKPADLNVRNVVLGDILFKTWYPSFYPEELIGRELERLFVCQWCFKYSKDLMPYLAHTVRAS